jgi:peptidase E
MTTKFVLHGGRLKLDDVRNDTYFRELVKDLHDGDTVLIISFACREQDKRREVFEREKGYLQRQTSADINIQDATYENLIEQIRQAKVIHISGGESPELVKDMQRYPDFIPSLRGKVVGGTSAGACLFSTYYYYGEYGGVVEGLGVFPIRLMVHYGNPEFYGTAENLEKLKDEPATRPLELLTLSECEWITKEADL